MQNKDNENRNRLNALLQKASGDIANLGAAEIQELQQLASYEVARGYRETFAQFHPGKSMIAALLLEEMHNRRLTRRQMCQKLGLSRETLGKVIAGKSKIGLHATQIIHNTLGVDANFLIDNL